MCARHDWSLPGSVTSSGFNDRKSILTCDMTDITNIKCFPDDEHGDNKKIFLCECYPPKDLAINQDETNLILKGICNL